VIERTFSPFPSLRCWKSVLFAMTLLPASPAFANLTIDTDFPGGNAVVESIEGDTVKIAPDNRDSKPWFYWNFAVRGAAGRTVTFVLKPQHVGVHGPGVSTDGGVTWKWLGADSVQDGTFSYTFPAGPDEIRFSVGMPYTKSQFDAFLADYKNNPFVHRETLTETPKGRAAPLLILSDPSRQAPYTVALTARLHCSEMMGSRVLEGLIQGVLADDEYGKWLRAHVDFFLVPFGDFDGVEDGDQGKGRTPHDHNRDFGDNSIYSEVIALKKRLPEWTKGRPLVYIDIHDPALKGDVHETIQFLAGEAPEQDANLAKFAAILEREQQGQILFRKNLIMKFGTAYNKLDAVPPPHASGWARSLPNCILGTTLEMPYANAGGFEVNATSAREFGRDIAWALPGFFRETSPDKAK
jgi:hypothetical protein